MVGEYIAKGKIFGEEHRVLIEMLTGNHEILTQLLLSAGFHELTF